MKFILNTVRKVDNDQTKEIGLGNFSDLEEKLAVIFMNNDDMQKTNLSINSNVEVSSEFGNVIVKMKADENLPSGVVSMPVSIWSNQITGVIKNDLKFKNINVSISSTVDKILSIEELIQKIREG